MQSFFDSIVDWFAGVWQDITEFFTDIFLSVVEFFLDGIAFLIESIPVPDVLQNGLQSSINALPSDVLFLFGALKIPEAFAIIGIGIAFRLVRKFVTLFQW